MAPRVSGGVAHAILPVPVSVSGERFLRPESAALLVTMCALILAQIVRTIWSRTDGKRGSLNATLLHLVPRVMSWPNPVRTSVASSPLRAGRHDNRRDDLWCASHHASMLDLCSAPCKALRFAPTALRAAFGP